MSERAQFSTMPPEQIAIDSDLKLRQFGVRDAANLLELASDAAVALFVPWAPRIKTLADAAATIEGFKHSRHEGTFARYVLEKQGQFIGYAGMWPEQAAGFYEFGFALLPGWRGRGIGKQVAETMVEIAKGSLRASGVVAYVNDDNAASQRVVRKLGFARTEQFDKGDRRYELRFD